MKYTSLLLMLNKPCQKLTLLHNWKREINLNDVVVWLSELNNKMFNSIFVKTHGSAVCIYIYIYISKRLQWIKKQTFFIRLEFFFSNLKNVKKESWILIFFRDYSKTHTSSIFKIKIKVYNLYKMSFLEKEEFQNFEISRLGNFWICKQILCFAFKS
jgi:hypothetical protein